MSTAEQQKSGTIAAKFGIPAAILALIGIADASYLSTHVGALIPCSVTGGCETVLSSAYASFMGIPLAYLGVAAYSVALLLIAGSLFISRKLWLLFGIQATLMAAASLYLIYLQAFVIHAFCQYCLLSATISILFFVVAVISRFWRAR